MQTLGLRLYHNPRCSKSRDLLQRLQALGLQPELVLYLQQPPTPAALQSLLAKLGCPARELLRSNESEYKTLGLDEPQLTEAQLIAAMCTHPRLIQRPILETATRAAIGRPLAAAEALLTD